MSPTLEIQTPRHQLDPENWVNSHANYLIKFAIWRINNEEVAKDMVQDTFLAGLKSLPRYRGDASERVWLTSILKFKITDYYRRANSNKGKVEIRLNDISKRHGNIEQWLENYCLDKKTEKDFESMESNELKQIIDLFLIKLPEKQYLAFKLKAIDGYSTEAICNELQMSRAYLCILINKTKLALMNHLNKEWF